VDIAADKRMIAINWLIGHVKLHAGGPSSEPQQQSVSQLEQDP
jgi:hypothetical protein